VEDIDVGAWINGTRMTDLHFADDIAALAENVTDLQEAVDTISIASTKMGMRIKASKTETLFLGKADISALTYKWMDSVYSRRKDSYTSVALSVRRKALKQMFRGESE